MISDSTILRGLVGVLGFTSLLLVYYLWYLILKQIHANDFTWFIFGFMILFGVIVWTFRGALDDQKIKDLEKRVKILEQRI